MILRSTINLKMQTLHQLPTDVTFPEKVKDFDPREGFRAPIFIPLAMMGVAQSKRAREWIKEELVGLSQDVESIIVLEGFTQALGIF